MRTLTELADALRDSHVYRVVDRRLIKETIARLREMDGKEMYCPTCESCGEDGCCNPGACIAVKCTYGADSVRAYKELLEENERLMDGERIEGWAELDEWWAERDLPEWTFHPNDGSLTDKAKKSMQPATLIIRGTDNG